LPFPFVEVELNVLAVRAESSAFSPRTPKSFVCQIHRRGRKWVETVLFVRNSILKFADTSEFSYEQLELEGLQRMSAKRKEQEQVRREATEDLAEDLSEAADTLGELVPVETAKKKFQRNFSDLTVWSDDNKEKKLYIVLIRS